MNDEQILIDASSLIYLVRYFIPFDNEHKIEKRLEKLFKDEFIIILSAIKDEIALTANGIVIKKLPFIEDIEPKQNVLVKDTDDLHNIIDDKWAIPKRKERAVAKGKYQNLKSAEIEKGDFQLILYAKELQKSTNVEPIIVTEESMRTNDRKLFKKIPLICKQEQPKRIKCINLSEMLKMLGLEAKYSWRNQS